MSNAIVFMIVFLVLITAGVVFFNMPDGVLVIEEPEEVSDLFRCCEECLIHGEYDLFLNCRQVIWEHDGSVDCLLLLQEEPHTVQACRQEVAGSSGELPSHAIRGDSGSFDPAQMEMCCGFCLEFGEAGDQGCRELIYEFGGSMTCIDFFQGEPQTVSDCRLYLSD